MKKNVSKRLNEIASKLPLVFKAEQDYVWMTGKELKLTPVDDMLKLEDDREYQIPIPKLIAVFHEQQVKDAYKRNGAEGVEEYVNSVINDNR